MGPVLPVDTLPIVTFPFVLRLPPPRLVLLPAGDKFVQVGQHRKRHHRFHHRGRRETAPGFLGDQGRIEQAPARPALRCSVDVVEVGWGGAGGGRWVVVVR